MCFQGARDTHCPPPRESPILLSQRQGEQTGRGGIPVQGFWLHLHSPFFRDAPSSPVFLSPLHCRPPSYLSDPRPSPSFLSRSLCSGLPGSQRPRPSPATSTLRGDAPSPRAPLGACVPEASFRASLSPSLSRVTQAPSASVSAGAPTLLTENVPHSAARP